MPPEERDGSLVGAPRSLAAAALTTFEQLLCGAVLLACLRTGAGSVFTVLLLGVGFWALHRAARS